MLVGLVAGDLRVVTAEEQDVRGCREEQRALVRQRGRSARRQPLVRSGDAAVHGEVAPDSPDDQEKKENENADPDPAPPVRAAFPLDRARPAIAGGAVVALGPGARAGRPCLQRDLALRPAAPIDAVRLLSGGHAASYVTRAGCPPIVSSGSISAGRRFSPGSSTTTEGWSGTARRRRRPPLRLTCSTGSTRRSRSCSTTASSRSALGFPRGS